MRLAQLAPSVAVAVLGLLLAGEAGARIEQLRRVDLSSEARRRSEDLSTKAGEALAKGDFAGALALADQGVAANPPDPWPHHDRGAALAGLRRVDEALAAFKSAEERFGEADRWGKSISIFDRARALADVGRCPEAAQEFGAYARYVEADEPEWAQQARRYAGQCHPRAAAPRAP